MSPQHYRPIDRYPPQKRELIADVLSIGQQTAAFCAAIQKLEQLATWLIPETCDDRLRGDLRKIEITATQLAAQLAEIDLAARRALGASREFEDTLSAVRRRAATTGRKKGAPRSPVDWAPFILGAADIWTATTDKPATCSWSRETGNYKGRFFDFLCAAVPVSVKVGTQSLGKKCVAVLERRKKVSQIATT